MTDNPQELLGLVLDQLGAPELPITIEEMERLIERVNGLKAEMDAEIDAKLDAANEPGAI